jgi:hypothetical protein
MVRSILGNRSVNMHATLIVIDRSKSWYVLTILIFRLILGEIFESLSVNNEIETSRAIWCKLSHDNILSDASKKIGLRIESRLIKDLYCLFKGAFSEWTSVYSVDTMAGYRSEDSSLSHDIAKGTQMAVVDVNAIATKHKSYLVDESQTYSLDSQYLQDFLDVV